MGKIAELSGGTRIGYTDRGQLVGHITIAAIWLQEKAGALAEETGEAFPQQTLNLLQHIILSHHGVHEYGSPKLPMIPEAYMIHYLDNLDAKMFMTIRDIEADADPTGSFTPYQPPARNAPVQVVGRVRGRTAPQDPQPPHPQDRHERRHPARRRLGTVRAVRDGRRS